MAEHGQGVSRADLVVAADGVRSVVRRQWWPGGGCLALEDAVTLAACLDTAPNLKALRGMDSILGWAVR